MLNRIFILDKNFQKYFKSYNFHNLYKDLLNFCTVDLSAFYFDIRKDTLYCDAKDSEKRKNSIIILNIILECLLKWFAPILSFTTEEIFSIINKENKSIHLEKFVKIPNSWCNTKLDEKWTSLKRIRDNCNISIEEKRAEKIIGSSLEAKIDLKLNDNLYSIAKNVDFAELCITSEAIVSQLKKNEEEISVKTYKAEGSKCPVCWKIRKDGCERHGHLS